MPVDWQSMHYECDAALSHDLYMLEATLRFICFHFASFTSMHFSLSLPASWQDASAPAEGPRASGAPRRVPKGRPSRLEQLGYTLPKETGLPRADVAVNESEALRLERCELRVQRDVLSEMYGVMKAEQCVMQRWSDINKRERQELIELRDELEQRELEHAVDVADFKLKESESELADLLCAREASKAAEIATVLVVEEDVANKEQSSEPLSSCDEKCVDARPRWVKRRKRGTKGKRSTAMLIETYFSFDQKPYFSNS